MNQSEFVIISNYVKSIISNKLKDTFNNPLNSAY